jgi:hypothetical protein
LLLPLVEHAGTDRRQVGNRQDVEHLQHLGRANLDRELHDHAVIGDVLLLRQMAHPQMLMHEKPQRLGVVCGQA